MCGIAGFFQRGGFVPEAAKVSAYRMADAIEYRGPDSAGVWLESSFGIALAHRRLAIIDLSPAGHQPMLSHSKRYAFTFNGEIYNHLQVRREIENRSPTPVPWQGRSDTETLLTCIDHLGVEDTLQRVDGMFAFALWDRQDKVLYLARDRLGEKPLYYGWQKQVFMFGSDLRAFRAHSSFEGEIDRNALTLFLRFNYIPAPWSIYKGVQKLLPGTYLRLSFENASMDPTALPEPCAYWSVKSVSQAGFSQSFSGGAEEATDRLHDLLLRSVGRQMVADVPLGVLLSGGIDSSIIAALMQAQSERPVKTFTIGFHDTAYNEAEYARAIARKIGTEHTELYITPRDVLEVVPRLSTLYSEPFADASQIPTFLISEMARRNVTVCLSGDGGDELFGGYERYRQAQKILRFFKVTPIPLRKLFASIIMAISPSLWDRFFHLWGRALPLTFIHPGNRLHKLAKVFRYDGHKSLEINCILSSEWMEPAEAVYRATEPPTTLTDPHPGWVNMFSLEEQMMLLDIMTYLPDDILTKVDRAAMGVSLETRMPFLDHHVVEFALRLPLSFKIQGSQGKWILRKICGKYLPEKYIKRSKMGFVIPTRSWFRGELRDWGETLLDQNRLRKEGFFDPIPIRRRWAEHLSGKNDWSSCLWSILMFQNWLEKSSS